MRNCFISTYTGEWVKPAEVLKKELGFEMIDLKGKEYPSISSKKTLLKKELDNVVNVIKHYKEINNSHILICSNYVTLFLLFLRKLHLLRVDTICWWGVYVHNPKMVKAIGRILRFVNIGEKHFKIVVFSRGERQLYSKTWSMPMDTFVYVPYGEWTFVDYSRTIQIDGDYYFSGGYSNRDYIPLIKAFEGRKDRLVIAASKHNVELYDFLQTNKVSDNISVKFDISQNEFDDLLRGSQGVFFIMKYNTGASGQMVLLNAMRNKKLIFSTYTDCVNEYVQNGVSGVVVNKKGVEKSIKEFLDSRSYKKEQYERYIENAYESYEKFFSYEALAKSLVDQVLRL